ncbi:MAG: type II secretion system GspH family protein [Eubacterium sp.]|nr:type II secretion system GspH family protein [Eubacterium sp.]
MNKKTYNMGFSLVELIIVIAIMAILSAAIAPALIRYINKARKADDIAAADSVGATFAAAVSENEDIYDFVQLCASDAKTNDNSMKYRVVCYMKAGYQMDEFHVVGFSSNQDLTNRADEEIGEIMGELMGDKIFKLKFSRTKNLDEWIIAVDRDANVYVFAAGGFGTGCYHLRDNNRVRGRESTSNVYMLWPTVDPQYNKLTTPNDVAWKSN